MQHADLHIKRMANWDLLRAYFQSGDVDMAFVMSPLAISMYQEKPHFKWVGLMHRDGNALAINKLLNDKIGLAPLRSERKPDGRVASTLKTLYQQTGQVTEIGMPHLLSTHSVVLYRYLKEHGLQLSLRPHDPGEVLAISIPPAKSPAFLRGKSNQAEVAAFEQSLPWADMVETGGFGYIAWYSKDVMPWPGGHVECIVLATKKALQTKYKAIKEVVDSLHLAGQEIENARRAGGAELSRIATMVRKHIPEHTEAAIFASLDPTLGVINYNNLDVDRDGLQLIMDYAVDAGILPSPIDIDAFTDRRFLPGAQPRVSFTH